MPDKQKLLVGRQAVDAYRTSHSALYQGANPNIPEAHTPLLNVLLLKLEAQGFNNLDTFFTASLELNVQEMGFKDIADFLLKATPADKQALNGKWH